MGMSDLQPKARQSAPSKADFAHDMNQHGNATYRTIGPYIIELEADQHRARGVVKVWEAMRRNGQYLTDRDDNNEYAWDGAAKTDWLPLDEARDEFAEATDGGKQKLREWGQSHPWGDDPKPVYGQGEA